MILLSFTVRNHKSIRDEATLDLTRPSLRTLQPRDGSWGESVYPLAGVFGANATGKSAFLDAINYAFTAIKESSSSWQASRRMRRAPFLLDSTSQEASSYYEFDFVYEGRRHAYGFEVDSGGIAAEWLRDVPSTRWRTLLDRRRDAGKLKLHPSLRSIGGVTSRELVMSRARLLQHPQLRPIGDELASSFDIVSVEDMQRERRLGSIADRLVDGSISFSDIESLLQAADIGVDTVSVQEEELPDKVRSALEKIRTAFEEEGDLEVSSSNTSSDELGDHESDMVVRNLLFTHHGESEERPKFSIRQESDGTVAWLALAVPALEAMRHGGLLCVDEIDSSLHPHLLDVLLGMFADDSLNPNGAQLIFTSHEPYLLSPLSEVELAPEQVWFTDKSSNGVTDMFCLADFPRHKDANVARRYLLGRYGGTPRLAPSFMAALVDSGDP